MNPLLVFIIVCFVIYLYEYRSGLIFSPAQLNVGFWSIVSISYVLIGDRAEVLSWSAVLALSLGVASFWLGGKVNINSRIRVPDHVSPDCSEYIFCSVVFLVLLFGLCGTLWKALSYVPLASDMPLFGGGGSWYENLRHNLILKYGGSFGFWGYFLGLSYAVTVYFVVSISSRRDIALASFSFIISLVYAFLATGRTFVLLLFVLLFVALRAKEIISRKGLVLFALPSAAFFFVVTPLLAGRLVMDMVDYFLLYFVAPLSNFNWGMNGIFACCTHGDMVFRTIFAILSKFGFDVRVVDLIQPWAQTKLSGNVYTVFMPYYRDFGFLGIAGFMFLFGMVHAWVARQATENNPLAMFISGILFYALVMQFFQDQYFSLLSQWIQMIFWMFILLWIRPIHSASSPRD